LPVTSRTKGATVKLSGDRKFLVGHEGEYTADEVERLIAELLRLRDKMEPPVSVGARRRAFDFLKSLFSMSGASENLFADSVTDTLH
jgi:hypothetical protein